MSAATEPVSGTGNERDGIEADGNEAAGVLDLMGTNRAMRWLRPDPVPPELIERLIWAATRAPSPSNTQLWDFVVVDDPGHRAELAAALQDSIPPVVARIPGAEGSARHTLEGAVNLMENLASVPVIIFVCGPVAYPAEQPDPFFTWSALFPAAQNLVLAARALGLGSTLTTLHRRAEPTVRRLLELPDDIVIAATIPIGWPANDFGPVRRLPPDEVTHHNRFRR